MYTFKSFLVTLALIGLNIGAQAQTHPALGGGTGTSTDPYRIETPAHLKDLADFVNGGTANGNATAGVYYIVINDLDLSAYATGEGWTPIGYWNYTTVYSYFKGNFNGNNKKVTNLTINRPTASFQGLFGDIYGAVIENFGVENCNITGKKYVGGLVGENETYSTISNCYATGNVSGTDYHVGGLAGDNYYASISNCYAAVNASGTSFVGGLVGYNDYVSTISDCYATGNVSGTGDYVGGLAGFNYYYSQMNNCYAIGNVSGAGYNVGGLVGENDQSSISNCYSTGNVNGTADYVGGLVGYNGAYSTISNSYSTGKVIGTGNYIGGLAGENNQFNAVMKNCVAANDSVVATTNATTINRICSATLGTLQNNYALSTMVVKNSSGVVSITDGLNTYAGMSKSINALQGLAFYTDLANWKDNAWSIDSITAVWNICDGKSLPFLRWQGINCNGDGVVTITDTDGIQIYPNPVKEMLYIDIPFFEKMEYLKNVEICDLSGRTVGALRATPLQEGNATINVSSLPQGVYFLKIQTDKGIITKKFIKQ